MWRWRRTKKDESKTWLKKNNQVRSNEINDKGTIKKVRKLNDGAMELIPHTRNFNIVDL